jgi:hypothetical protein
MPSIWWKLYTTIVLLTVTNQCRSEYVKITNALVFKKLKSKNIFYKSSIPLIYKEQLNVNREEIIKFIDIALWDSENEMCRKNNCTESKKKETECLAVNEKVNRERCANESMAQHRCEKSCQKESPRVIEKVKQLMKDEMTAAIFDISVELQTRTRAKRAIQILGKFLRFCCGTALDLDLTLNEQNTEKMSVQYEKLRQAAIENHKGLFTFQKDLYTIADQTSQAIRELKERENQISERSETRHALAHQFEILIMHYRELVHYCQAGKLPGNVVGPNILKEDVTA